VCDFGGVPLDHLIPSHSAWTNVDDLFVDLDAADPIAAPVQGLVHRHLSDVVGTHLEA
jgi:hypothetical protein